ncbi:MAG: sulfatase-like hydrolase/transferase, partial [Planctomycetota bacterium]
KTPNIDRMIDKGMLFTHAYNMGSWSGAVCVASRTMLNTGRFLWSANSVYQKTDEERAAGRFWSEYMKKAGYTTYMTGKWHVKADTSKAFDVTADVRGGMPNQTPEGYNRPIEGQPDPWSPYDKKFEGFWKGGKHWSEIVGDHAVDFLGRAKEDDNPFFMYIAFNAPHDPRQSPKRFVDMYPLDAVPTPRNFLSRYPYDEQIGCGPKLRDAKLAPFPRTEYAVKVNRQEYYAIITHMDREIGRILDALEASGKADNTYVFFTADHGLAVGRHGLIGKQNMYDHSVRVPFVVNGPGVEAGSHNDAWIYLQDIMPTTLELAGVKKPDHVDFHSLLPLINDPKAKSPYKSIYGAYLKLQRSIRVGKHKLILYPEVPVARLYNLKTDPLEMHDMAAQKSKKKMVSKLFGELLEQQRELGDELDLRAAFPDL